MGPKSLFGHAQTTLSNLFENNMPPAKRGAWGLRGGLGLPVRVLILGHIPPVGSLIVRLVARGQILNRVVVFHRLHAVLAQVVAVGRVLAVAATRAAGLGAGGFFAVAGGAHAHMIA